MDSPAGLGWPTVYRADVQVRHLLDLRPNAPWALAKLGLLDPDDHDGQQLHDVLRDTAGVYGLTVTIGSFFSPAYRTTSGCTSAQPPSTVFRISQPSRASPP